MDYKIVIGTKKGKSFQKEIKSPEADALHKKRIGEKISGDEIGLAGYQFEITGGSDKCGFPMRKGIQQPRKRVNIGESVGFSGQKRFLNKKKNLRKQKGLFRRRTVCGERVTGIINQVNLKVLKEGKAPLGEEKAEGKAGAVEKAPAASEKESKPEEKEKTAQPTPESAGKEEKPTEKPSPDHPPPDEGKSKEEVPAEEKKEEPKVEGEAEGKPEAELSDKEKDKPKED